MTTDTFNLHNDYIQVMSKSGSEYTITIGSCTCRGFSFHHICRHYEQAEAMGLIAKLKVHTPKQVSIKLSAGAIVARKEAVRQFLTKNGIGFTEDLINKIEPKVKVTTTSSEVLSMAQSLKGGL